MSTTETHTHNNMRELRDLLNRLDSTVDAHQRTLVTTRDDLLKQQTARTSDEISRLIFYARRTVEDLERRIEAQQKERGKLIALQRISAAVNSSLDLNQVLNTVMDAITELTEAERAILLLIDEESGRLEVKAARTKERQTIEPEAAYEISRSVVQMVTGNGEAVVTTNAQLDPRFSAQESIISYNLRSIVCVPLQIKETITGVIYADNRVTAGIFNDTDRDLLQAFANQAAIAVENALLFQQIRNHLVEITEMKDLMDNVFESINSGVITVDEEDRIALYNRAAERIFNVPTQSVLFQAYEAVLTLLQLPVKEMIDAVRANGDTQSSELDVSVQDRSGATSLNLTFSPLRDIQQQTLGVAVVLDDVSEKKRLESVRRYLPPALVEQLREFESSQRPQRRTMSVLFADVRGFSTYSEKLEPEKLIEVINGYFTEAVRAITQYEGLTDKFMGDAVMALYNTPLNPQPDHVERAVRTALMIQRQMSAYHATLPPDRRLHFGIGVHVGEAVVGNVGSTARKDYSAIGDAVNLAKRLQENAEPDEVIISQAVYDAVRDRVTVEALEPIQVKGRQALEQIYRVVI